MLEHSPLYRYKDLTTPVLLAHGTEDRRIDFEHTRRLQRMLALAGRPPILVELTGSGHALDDVESRHKVWHALAGFLRQHLGTMP